MIKYKVIVRSMTATYTGEIYANSPEEAVSKVRKEYKRKKDNRADWDIKVLTE